MLPVVPNQHIRAATNSVIMLCTCCLTLPVFRGPTTLRFALSAFRGARINCHVIHAELWTMYLTLSLAICPLCAILSRASTIEQPPIQLLRFARVFSTFQPLFFVDGQDCALLYIDIGVGDKTVTAIWLNFGCTAETCALFSARCVPCRPEPTHSIILQSSPCALRVFSQTAGFCG